jgi:hypothetical protein
MLDSKDLARALEEQKWIQEHPEVPQGTMSQQWRSMLGIQQGKKIIGCMRQFSEEVDAEFTPLRRITMWEGEEANK